MLPAPGPGCSRAQGASWAGWPRWLRQVDWGSGLLRQADRGSSGHSGGLEAPLAPGGKRGRQGKILGGRSRVMVGPQTEEQSKGLASPNKEFTGHPFISHVSTLSTGIKVIREILHPHSLLAKIS